ncbi:MAG: hypothetical protein IPK97_03950 [Ahniella sp.]|nr:hypothetical protein [Ahniella sp.]
MIRSRLLWVVCLMLASVEVVACSFSGSPVFKVGRARMNASEGKAETLTLMRVNFIPAISGMGSCDGTGLITVQVRSDRGGKRHFKQRGILVSPLAENPGKAYLPAKPLKPYVDEDGAASITWAWGTPPPADKDRYWRWSFSVRTIDRSGVLGEPIEVCASTDHSCELAGH